MSTIDEIKSILWGKWLPDFLLAILIGMLVSQNYFLAILALCTMMVLGVTIKHPLRAMALLIFLMPFANQELLMKSMIPIPGGKSLNLVEYYLILVSVLNLGNSRRIPFRFLLFSIFFMILLTLSIYRSLDYLYLFNQDVYGEMLPPIRYWMSNWFRPMIYFSSFLIVLKYTKKEDDIRFIFNAISFAAGILGLFVLYLYFFKSPDRLDPYATADIYFEIIGFDRNKIGTFLLISFPIVFTQYFIKKDMVGVCLLLIVLIATGFTFSRSAYVTVLAAFIFYLTLSGRRKWLPFFFFTLFILFSFISTSVIIERASVGISSNNPNEISAGRIEQIWLPLIQEMAKNPTWILFGKGRFSIVASEAQKIGLILPDIVHPHNMYLEILMDAGIVGLGIMLWFYGTLIFMGLNQYRKGKIVHLVEYFHGSFISIISFFIAGLMERSFFPSVDNFYFWIVLGCYIVILDMNQRNPSLRDE